MECQRSFNSKNPHFPVFIHSEIGQCILHRMANRKIHLFTDSLTRNPSLIRDRLRDPVRLFIPGQIHTEQEQFSPHDQFILSWTQFQFPLTDIGK